MTKSSEFKIDSSFGWIVATTYYQLRKSLNQKFLVGGLDITSEQWVIMATLWNNEGVSQQAIADKLSRSKVAVYKLIERLENSELVIRKPNPHDARGKQVYLSARGKRILKNLIRLSKENFEKAREGITDQELEVAKSVLRRITENINR